MKNNKIFSIPNIITSIRLLFIPIMLVYFFLAFPHYHGVTATIFLLGSATDWLDGYLARKCEQTTKLGAFLDPVADKLIVSAALCVVVQIYPYFWATIPAIIIICREITVSALREWMAELGSRSIVKVGIWGKIKTATQMAAIFVFLYKPTLNFQKGMVDYGDFNTWLVLIGFVLLYIAVILTVYSMCIYLWASYKYALKDD